MSISRTMLSKTLSSRCDVNEILFNKSWFLIGVVGCL